MSKTVRVLRIFVASPSDVEEERAALEDVIAELNKTLPHGYRIMLELVRSETDTYPGIGVDAQDVINPQIADDYHVFIGIMWMRFGTPTARAGSGTEEEFNRAYSRSERGEQDIQIMLYFKDAPIQPSKVDLEQAFKVRSFKDRVRSAGVYYYVFTTCDDFVKHFRLHISLYLKQRYENPDMVSRTSTRGHVVEEQTAPAEEDELGYIDYLELFEDAMGRLGQFADKSVEVMELLNKRIASRSDEYSRCRGPDGSTDLRQAKKVSSKMAEDLNGFAVSLDNNLHTFSEAYAKAIDAAQNAFMLSRDFKSPSEDEKEQLRQQIIGFVAAIAESREAVSDFRKNIDTMPRTTSDFNRARRRTRTVLDRTMEEFEKAISLFSELGGAVGDL